MDTTAHRARSTAVVLASAPDTVAFLGPRTDARQFIESQQHPAQFSLRKTRAIEHGFTELGEMLAS
jgi:hypothetical protein